VPAQLALPVFGPQGVRGSTRRFRYPGRLPTRQLRVTQHGLHVVDRRERILLRPLGPSPGDALVPQRGLNGGIACGRPVRVVGVVSVDDRDLSGDMQNPSGGDTRNPATLHSRGEMECMTRQAFLRP